MYKRILCTILGVVLISVCIPNSTLSDASVQSKGDFLKMSSIDWMYKNMRMSTREKLKKDTAYKRLDVIYTRVMQERFGEVKLSIIRTESAFDNTVVGQMKELCMMQINPIWRKELKAQGIIKQWTDLKDANTCIAAGSFIFDQYYEKYNSVEKAVVAYNGGGDPEYKKKILFGLGSLKLAHAEAKYNYNILNGLKNVDVIE